MLYTMGDVAVEANFLEHGWWIQFYENKVDLWIGEDLLMEGRMSTGLGQCQGHVFEIVPYSSKTKYFFYSYRSGAL